jgi:hypothetical protein
MQRVLLIAVLLRFMDSFMIYTEPFVLTGGGPGNATTFLSIDLVKLALGRFDLGKAAAMSLVYNLIIVATCRVFYTIMTNVDAERRPAGAAQDGARHSRSSLTRSRRPSTNISPGRLNGGRSVLQVQGGLHEGCNGTPPECDDCCRVARRSGRTNSASEVRSANHDLELV